MYNTATLPNGLRVIHLPSSSPVVYCGYEIAAGSACEDSAHEGLAHFCEHMTFKGTRRRTSIDVIDALESVGGDLNAYTTKTDTVYYAAILKDSLPQAVDVLTDIVFHSTYPQKEIAKEVEVICDEIESYNDSPAELVYDEFDNLVFKGTPLGHNILGTAPRVRTYTTADAAAFTERLYRPANSIFFAYGNVDFDGLCRMLAAMDFGPAIGPVDGSAGGEAPAEAPSPYIGQTVRIVKNTHQAHVMLGCRAYGVDDERRMPLYLLNNIIGGPGMNAWLNLSLRERHGLVYTVESTMVSYATTGTWSVYFGCDPHDVDECLKLVRDELDHAAQHTMTDGELAAAKRQIKGQIGIACDNRENFALDFGKAFLHYGWEKDVDKLYEKIDAITAPQLRDVACDIFDSSRLTTLIFE